MEIEIKLGKTTIYDMMYYWEDPKTGYRISIIRGPDCFLTSKNLKEVLLEKVQDYLNAQRLSKRHLR